MTIVPDLTFDQDGWQQAVQEVISLRKLVRNLQLQLVGEANDLNADSAGVTQESEGSDASNGLTAAAAQDLVDVSVADHVADADPHTVYLRKAQNLADLTDATTARSSLGLGTMATVNTAAVPALTVTASATFSTTAYETGIVWGSGGLTGKSASNIYLTSTNGTLVTSVTTSGNVATNTPVTLNSTLGVAGKITLSGDISQQGSGLNCYLLGQGALELGSSTDLEKVLIKRPVVISGTRSFKSDGSAAFNGIVSSGSVPAVAFDGDAHIGTANVRIGVVSGCTLGFLGTTGTGRITQAAPSAIATTETSGGAYAANEQTMLANLKTDVTNLRGTLNTLITNLRGSSGYGLFG